MHDVILRNSANRCSQLSQYVSEQPEVDVHVNRFVDVVSAWPFQDQRDASRIEMRLKSRRPFKCTNIDFVRVFERDLGLVGNGFRDWGLVD